MNNDILYFMIFNWLNILIKDKKIPKQLVNSCIEQYEQHSIFFTKNTNYKNLKEKLLKHNKILISEVRDFFNSIKQDKYTNFTYTGNLKNREVYLSDIKFKDTLYINFNCFSDTNCYKLIKDITKSTDKKFLILDLRGNIGGNIENAIKICNLLTKKCEIVTLCYKYKTITYYSDEIKIYFKNITIFVDNNTSSSSEMLTLSLKENNDNVNILGTETSHKKIGQTAYYNKKYKYYFAYSSFRWTVNGADTNKLDNYICRDNNLNKNYKSYNDYIEAYIKLIRLDK